jgi:BirA family biotin operon repressor/biotin-[acetyl-CoA-carboxylase] ligase
LNLDFQHEMRAALENRVGNLILLSAIDSTHRLARRLIDQVDADDVPLRPALFVAERQTGGCGRDSRRWESPSGGLYLSWVSSDIAPESVPLLPLLAASAAQRSLAEVGLTEGRIKWPNDILVGGRKIAGLLIHARHGDRVLTTIGLGVNIEFTPAVEGDIIVEPTSLAEELGPESAANRAATVAAGFLDFLHQAIADPETAVGHWRRHLVHKTGDAVNVCLSGGEIVRGRFAGVTEQGYLKIEGPKGERTLTSGDVIEK